MAGGQPGFCHRPLHRRQGPLPAAALHAQHPHPEVPAEVRDVPGLQGPSPQEGRLGRPLCLRSKQTGKGCLVSGSE